ncbi:uncharacterized protein LOC118923037 isoform X5 [Manis pentadactyla]|uniref:uncharacterized protein LOC118923037 isoform X5 n=1 Tax=Manis pentadactyla TaxID=143292 RepID=UPI00255CB673|nr:uncharacterized protein LOC118923037 isoform X5 [Manis pentadactyla]
MVVGMKFDNAYKTSSIGPGSGKQPPFSAQGPVRSPHLTAKRDLGLTCQKACCQMSPRRRPASLQMPCGPSLFFCTAPSAHVDAGTPFGRRVWASSHRTGQCRGWSRGPHALQRCAEVEVI